MKKILLWLGEFIATVVALLIALLIFGWLIGLIPTSEEEGNLGSVTVGNEYNATSTPSDALQADGQIDKGSGTLGSVVITSAGDMIISLLDATTTDATIRPAGQKATSTIEIARINTATVGTYTFDVNYNVGLLLDVVSGTTGTTTITYR